MSLAFTNDRILRGKGSLFISEFMDMIYWIHQASTMTDTTQAKEIFDSLQERAEQLKDILPERETRVAKEACGHRLRYLEKKLNLTLKPDVKFLLCEPTLKQQLLTMISNARSDYHLRKGILSGQLLSAINATRGYQEVKITA